jgi:hypothetical protein
MGVLERCRLTCFFDCHGSSMIVSFSAKTSLLFRHCCHSIAGWEHIVLYAVSIEK